MKPLKKGKRAYHKPALRLIELVADEVMGLGCKMGGSTAGVPDMAICAVTACDQLGS